MTPEERAKSVLHFLDEYLEARDHSMHPLAREADWAEREKLRQFLGTSLVALVTDARKIDE